jgi:hypothetical protein
MKLTKQTLKRIIKEELDSIMKESLTRPWPGNNIPDKYVAKIDDLILSGDAKSKEQARELIIALGGNPSYVEEYRKFLSQSDMVKMADRHHEEGSRWDDYDFGIESEENLKAFEDFYGTTTGHDKEFSDTLRDKYGDTPEVGKAANDHYIGRTNDLRREKRKQRGM